MAEDEENCSGLAFTHGPKGGDILYLLEHWELEPKSQGKKVQLGRRKKSKDSRARSKTPAGEKKPRQRPLQEDSFRKSQFFGEGQKKLLGPPNSHPVPSEGPRVYGSPWGGKNKNLSQKKGERAPDIC